MCVMVWSEAKDQIILTAVKAEGSREWGTVWQIHKLLLNALSVLKNLYGILPSPRKNNLPSQLY